MPITTRPAKRSRLGSRISQTVGDWVLSTVAVSYISDGRDTGRWFAASPWTGATELRSSGETVGALLQMRSPVIVVARIASTSA